MYLNNVWTVLIAVGTTLVSAQGVQYGGVNIAGFDFGCSTDGTCPLGSQDPPTDGAAQMQHFVTKDKLNVFRLPVGWQYLLNNQLGGTLDAGNFGQYDELMQACLKTGAACIIDIHNYARWDGKIIGQGGPSVDDFANLWTQLATKYADQKNVWMGLMNEPHDIPDMNGWASAVQAAVNAIRKAGANTQTILIPGNQYTNVGAFASTSGSAMEGVTDPAGGTDKLIFEVHAYFDADNSGTTTECVSNKISDGFQVMATYLNGKNRKAFVAEMGGGGNAQSCVQYICEALDFMNQNSDIFLGYAAWSAGAFPDGYALSLVPKGDTDVPLMEKCFAAKFGGGSGVSPSSSSGGNGTTTPSTPTTPTEPTDPSGTASGSTSTATGSGSSSSGSGIVSQPGPGSNCRPGTSRRRRRGRKERRSTVRTEMKRFN